MDSISEASFIRIALETTKSVYVDDIPELSYIESSSTNNFLSDSSCHDS